MIKILQKIPFNFCSSKKTVTLFPGHGIGPEISDHVETIYKEMKIPIQFEKFDIFIDKPDVNGNMISQQAIDSIFRNKYALKGPFMTPIGKGFKSLNITLRKKFNLFANVRPCMSIPGIITPYSNVNVVTIRENTEGEYSGLEHQVVEGIVENLKIISEKACRNISEYAFEFAKRNNRKKVTACHKAAIMKMGDGLFIDICKDVASKYPEIEYNDEQIDTVCFKLARNPQELDVMVMPNLYGDIVSDLCAGLIGGLGLTPSGNIGSDIAIYEAVHGTAPDIAGKDLANPTALLMSGNMMLIKMGFINEAQQIKDAVLKTYGQGKFLTGDLGGKSKGSDFTRAVIDNLQVKSLNQHELLTISERHCFSKKLFFSIHGLYIP